MLKQRIVLIVAECNVNLGEMHIVMEDTLVLIVAECNVNTKLFFFIKKSP